MLKLPTLYKKNTNGSHQEWTISVQPIKATGHAVIRTVYGQVGGALQDTMDTVEVGKNVGRANETSPYEQAEAEARAKWLGKKKKGYVESLDSAKGGEVDASVIAGGVAPMLAQKFAEHGHKIFYPAFIQRKYDGVRCIAVCNGGHVSLWTRTRKPITSVPHIIPALLNHVGKDNVIFDGELYVHGMAFERLISIVRQVKPIFDHVVIEYHIYDLVSSEGFRVRSSKLAALLGTEGVKPLVPVPTRKVHDLGDVTRLTKEFIAEGYEGSIVRQAETPYEVGKRSYGLQKVKEFTDAEFKIVGVSEGRGRMAACAIFICETPGGGKFSAKMEGSLENLKQYLTTPRLWEGKKLTVRFQGLTSDGIPRFPVGVAVRDYE